ncbi:TPA: restriction endonuclease subunit S [Enterococcus faecium]|uniref:restriction endonuclease subunit S n=2 Tax=Enterococcus faecium TaxID=1352 RepID=UPI0021E9052A|nr:restriction endonuclease subunit S [Enterococcus faecium]MCV3180447.1 restriction endonuclease subunit S [Enterococcus faecium]MDV7829086.1 restriction endonuclease subunit S [Enterococcus faecium]
MSNDTQPEIRFPGFTDDWEQRKFGVTNSYFTDGNYGESYPSADELSDKLNGVPFLRGSNLKNGRLVEEDANYITPEKHAELTSGHLELDDIVVAVRGSLGALGYAGQENVGWNINSQLAIIRTDKSELKGQFLIQYLLSSKGQKELLSRNTGTALKQLPIKQLKDVPVPIPGIDEQDRIGSFFVNLDTTITLHQRKLDLLKETKKGFLQKMFPKNGAKVPEIRFPGFTEDWEERRLQEVVDRYDNLRIPITASKRVAGNTPYYGANGIQGYVEGYTHDGEFILVAEDGANDLKNYPVQYVDGKVWVNNHAHVIQAKENLADNMFLMNAIRSINIEPFLVGGGRAKLNADVLMKLEVIIPLKSEQQKIGAFFKQLDDTIALHQRKLDLLKETKKGFLQKMFV